MKELVVWPAVDLQAGRQVGLVQGNLDQARAYGDAVAFARARGEEGFLGLHVVDLDGATRGKPESLGVVQAIRDGASELFLEVGGGIRTVADALTWIAMGIDRVVLGTAAFQTPQEGSGNHFGVASAVLRDCLDRFGPDRVAVAVDTRGTAVLQDAWRRTAGVTLAEAARDLARIGVRCVVHTEATRDGSLAGVQEQGARILAEAGFEVAAAGGIAATSDLERLLAVGARTAIVGRAFHAGDWRVPTTLSVEDAL